MKEMELHLRITNRYTKMLVTMLPERPERDYSEKQLAECGRIAEQENVIINLNKNISEQDEKICELEVLMADLKEEVCKYRNEAQHNR